jgi:hypothetical protein
MYREVSEHNRTRKLFPRTEYEIAASVVIFRGQSHKKQARDPRHVGGIAHKTASQKQQLARQRRQGKQEKESKDSKLRGIRQTII